MKVRFLIGIDNTDGPDSRGTGFFSRQLGELIVMNKLGNVKTISRHYLYPYAEDPFSSHNSAICMEVMTPHREALVKFCTDYIQDESHGSSQPGICVAAWDRIKEDVVSWAQGAKKQKQALEDALGLAASNKILLKGWNAGDGMIGALAATGLRKSGNDGRFIWLQRLRELSGAYSAEDLMALTAVDNIMDTRGEPINPEALIEVGEWVRPVIINHNITIIVRENEDPDGCPWIATSKEYIYSISR